MISSDIKLLYGKVEDTENYHNDSSFKYIDETGQIKEDKIYCQNDNLLFYGDNLDILQMIRNDCYDLIYADPPFNSKRNYNQIFRKVQNSYNGNDAQVSAFIDTWEWNNKTDDAVKRLISFKEGKNLELLGNVDANKISDLVNGFDIILGKCPMSAYLIYMTERLIQMYRVLKDTGSICLHCDSHASHYLKILMDNIFGHKNFRNEIVWCYKSGGASKHHFSRKHDVILFYSKTDRYKFKQQKEKSYNRDFKPYNFEGVEEFKDDDGRWYTIVNMKDWWEVDIIGRTSKERLGYDTQKPVTLISRVVESLSPEDGIVLDPFCGSGTTSSVCESLGRKWTTIDISIKGIEITSDRLKGEFPNVKFKEYGTPTDLYSAKKLWEKDTYEFQCWIIKHFLNGRPNKRGGDKSIDGWVSFMHGRERKDLIIEVKGGKDASATQVRTLIGAVNTNHSKGVVGGIFITLEYTESKLKEMKKVADDDTPNIFMFYNQKYKKIQILTLEDLFNGQRPQYPVGNRINDNPESEKITFGKSTRILTISNKLISNCDYI